jgi:coenzyme F420 hydrogenase subunit beta
MIRTIQTLEDVVDWGLCTGCGACHYHCKMRAVSLVNIPNIGIRPQFDSEACSKCRECISICPGYNIKAQVETGDAPTGDDGYHEFGPALEIWEGYASDPEIRYNGSSGGVLSALALYCLEREGMEFALHAGADDNKPWMNRTRVSVNRKQLLANTGSRYGPSSPCDGLQNIEESAGPCVFIGKPCDTAAVAMLRRQRERLDQRLGLVLTFFCAGTPSMQGTLDLLRSMDVNPLKVLDLRYRGQGWPGEFRVAQNNGSPPETLSYAESWDRLTRYRPLRCNLCPDGLGRIADISCGDAWHKLGENGDAGRSLVLVRTERGREILHRAIAAKCLELTRVDAGAVVAAQTSLLQRRRELFGRLVALRLLMIPTPKFSNFSLARSWLRLSLRRKMQTIGGTLSRAVRRGWWRRRPPITEQPSAEFHNA